MLITCPKCSVQYEIPEGVHVPLGKKMKCSNCQHVFILNEENPQQVVPEAPLDLSQPVEVNPVLEEESETTAVFAEDDTFKPEDVPQPFLPVPAVIEEKRTVGVWALILSILLLVSLAAVGIFYRDVLFGDLISVKSSVVQDVLPARVHPQPETSFQKMKPVVAPVRSGDQYIEETPQIVMLPQIQSVHFEKKQGENLEISIEGILKNPTTQPMKLPKKVRAFAYDSQGEVLFEKEIYLTDTLLPAGETLPFFGTYQPAPDSVQWIEVTF